MLWRPGMSMAGDKWAAGEPPCIRGVLPWSAWCPRMVGQPWKGRRLCVEELAPGTCCMKSGRGVRVVRVMSSLTNMVFRRSPTLKVFLGGACLKLPLPRFLLLPFIGSGVPGGYRAAPRPSNNSYRHVAGLGERNCGNTDLH